SLWEANMDLLDEGNALNLRDGSWTIYTEDIGALPQYLGPNSEIDRAYITEACKVDGLVRNSVLFSGAEVATGAKVIDSVLMPNVKVEEGAVVTRALVASDVVVEAGTTVGSAKSKNITLVAADVKEEE
ncbi:MAG: glucose-1-phosphate adenylyltransferase, partial [Eubacterium sp.]|nr:glucose-1-phosphate adenylyltransferase [Eubacterium sp.]